MTGLILQIAVPFLMYIVPGIIAARYFKSIMRGVIVGVSAFITPVITALLAILLTTVFINTSGEAATGWGMVSILVGIVIGYPLGLILPVVIFIKKNIPNNRVELTEADAQGDVNAQV